MYDINFIYIPSLTSIYESEIPNYHSINIKKSLQYKNQYLIIKF